MSEFDPELEDRNFHQLESGTVFATTHSEKDRLVVVNSESHEDITDEYIAREADRPVINKPITLSMFTTSVRAIRQDCACYFMEELRIG